MNGRQYAGANEECSQKAQRECSDSEQHCPALKATSCFCYCERMNQSCAYEPWHERGILNRIPKPPSAPTQFVVSPETTKRDSASQKHPRDSCPWSRPSRPCCV